MTALNYNESDILQTAQELRWEVGQDFHERLMENIYSEAAHIADRAVTWPDQKPRFDLDRTIDRIVTSRRWGFPLMFLLFTLVFWLTISGANFPSRILATILLETIYPFLIRPFSTPDLIGIAFASWAGAILMRATVAHLYAGF